MVEHKIAVNGRFLTQPLTGVQRYAYEIVKNLLAQGIKLIVYVPDKPLVNSYEIKDWPIVRLKFFGGQLWEQTSLPLFLRLKPANGILLNLCNTAPLLYQRNIITLHDLAFNENPAWFKRKFVWSYKWAIPRLLKSSEAIITVSNFSKTEIERYYPFTKGKIKVIYNAASTLNSDTIIDSWQFLKSNGLVKDKYILSVGSIEPRKNLQTLIQSFDKLNEDNLDLVLVGAKGNVFNGVDLKIERNKRIKVLGYVSDKQLLVLYKNALCFVYPSLYEGFGIPPLEAMQNGCPVIASNILSLKEVCQDAALFVSPTDYMDILSRIQLLIQDNNVRNELRSAGLKRSIFFSWKDSAKRMNQILNNSY